MATILLGFHCNILCVYKVIFKSYSFTAKQENSEKRKFLILSLDISRIFYHYKIVLSLFATENKQYFIIMKNMIIK